MKIDLSRYNLEPERPQTIVLSVDVTAKEDRPTRWVLTTTEGYSELIHEASNLNATKVADLTGVLAVAYDADRVLVRGYGPGIFVADALAASVRPEDRKYEVWTVYPGQRKAYDAAE